MTKDFKSGFISALMVACLFVAGCAPEGEKTNTPADSTRTDSASTPNTLTLSFPNSNLPEQKDEVILQKGGTGFVVASLTDLAGKYFFPDAGSSYRFHFPSDSTAS